MMSRLAPISTVICANWGQRLSLDCRRCTARRTVRTDDHRKSRPSSFGHDGPNLDWCLHPRLSGTTAGMGGCLGSRQPTV